MDCVVAEELLAEAVDGSLDEGRRAALDAHLEACVRCRTIRSALAEVREILAAAHPVMQPSEGLAERVAQRALERRAAAGRALRAARWNGVLRLAAGIALLAAGVALLASGKAIGRVRDGGRLVTRSVNAVVRLAETTDRLVEDVRILKVLATTAFQGRLEQVGERVDDYKRLIERRRASQQAVPPGGKKSDLAPFSNGTVPLFVGVDVGDQGAEHEQHST
jgi:hypothetical protein